MINLKKIQFVIIMILACILLPINASELKESNEPNNAASELKYEISKFPIKWELGHTPGRGPVKPEYMVEFYVKSSSNLPERRGTFEKPLQTNSGKSMSPKQKEFLKTSSSYNIMSESSLQKPIGYVGIQLFAVSQDDAKKKALAFAEILNEEVQERRSNYEWEIGDREQMIAEAKKGLPEKESQLEAIKQEYDKMKKQIHTLSSDTEAVDLAKKSIIEMDKTLNGLEIELAGITERLKTIEKYRQNPETDRPEVFTKLDVMYVELIVELSGLKAKKEMTEKINSTEQHFVSLFYQLNNLHDEVRTFSSRIENYPKKIEQIKNELKTSPAFQLPEIYQNTVKIYPVIER
ncbi:MAG: hypothetical protein JXA96_14495 [Sedimentisphaerales bacterium]|nr:hypothetical protein [Sedimentisphaerales bacterium]